MNKLYIFSILMTSNQSLLSILDNLPFSRWHMVMVLALGTIWIFDGYEVSLITLFGNYIKQEYSEQWFKLIITFYQVGCMIGSIGFGFCAYFYGRKMVFMVTLFIYLIGIVFSIIPSTKELFGFGRLLTGISVGGQFTSIFSAIDEFLPPHVRGRVDIAIDGTWHLGGSFAAIFNILIGETESWRILFGVGFLGIFALVCLRRNIPESPRWLLLKGKQQEAKKIVGQIKESVENGQIFLNEDFVLEDQFQSQQLSGTQSNKELNMSSMWRQMSLIGRNYKKRLFVSVLLIFSQALYFNSVYYKIPLVLKQQYHIHQDKIPVYMLPLSIVSFISTLLVGPFFDIFGRKKMILLTYGLSAILLGFTMLANTSIEYLAIAIIMFMFSSPAASAANLIASEIFPTSTRSIVLSLIFIMSMVGGICGVWMTSEIYGIVMMGLSALLGYVFCPNGQNKSLEELNQF